MKHFRFTRAALVALACTGVVLPSQAVMAQDAAPIRQQAPAVADVTLGQGGLLHGQVVDAQGAPRAAQVVSLQQNGKAVATITTNEQGQFAVRGVRGGTYTVATQHGVGEFRVWSAETAPPAARSGALVVSDEQTALGNCCSNAFFNKGTLTILAITGGIVAVGVASDDDDNFDGS